MADGETKGTGLAGLCMRRRTVRRYSRERVGEGLLRGLLEAAARTQTMGNLQLYSVVVTREEAMKEALTEPHLGQPMVKEASVVLTVCADFRRTTRWCECRRAVPGYDNVLSFVNAATDALLFTQTLSCLAEEAGLGVCFLGTTVYEPERIIEVLGLPRLVMPVATLTLGWPAEEPALSDRLGVEAFVHEERYRDYTEGMIDELYAEKEALEENRHFVELNGKETLAQVFTDCRYTKADNEAMSEGFVRALRRQGFLPAE